MSDEPDRSRRARRRTRSRSGQGALASEPVFEPSEPSNEFAWRVHDGITEWTARVDSKASIALAIEAAVAGVVVLLATGDGELARTSGLTSWLVGSGVVLLTASVVLAVLVVYPQLRARSTRKEFQNDVIYFGHLRLWDPEHLEERLATDSVEMAGLSRQLVRMSKIAWRKHVWLQWSLALFVLGVLAVGAALVDHRVLAEPASGGSEPSSVTWIEA